jgi:uncharacterized protein
MLIQFLVRNYRSIDKKKIMTAVASGGRSGVILETAGVKILPSVAIYGANASGKSNVLKAFKFVRMMVGSSSKESRIGKKIRVEPFALNSASRDKVSEFEVIFSIGETLFRYGFSASDSEIVSEWLYRDEKREVRLFSRSYQAFDVAKTAFPEGDGLTDRTRPDALFLSVCAQFNGPISNEMVSWFEKVGFLEADPSEQFTQELMSEAFKCRLRPLISIKSRMFCIRMFSPTRHFRRNV